MEKSKWLRSAIIGLILPFSMGSSTPYRAPIEYVPLLNLPEVTISAKKIRKTYRKEFMGFKLRGSKFNFNISEKLEAALADYSGPAVGINSLRRHWSRKSKHYVGRAVDMEFSYELIDWLVGKEGTIWREAHRMTFYIEGYPGSRKVAACLKEEKYSKFVLFNEGATGDHIHMEL